MREACKKFQSDKDKNKNKYQTKINTKLQQLFPAWF
jgi:hypothetical protein